MKAVKYLLTLNIAISFCSCREQVTFDKGIYYTMSMSVTPQAVSDSIDWTKAQTPIFNFQDRYVTLSNDYLNAFGDTLFKYKVTNDYLILKGCNKNKYEYKLHKMTNGSTITIHINSKYLKTIDLIYKYE